MSIISDHALTSTTLAAPPPPPIPLLEQPLTPDDLVGFCRDGLAHFKAPRRVVGIDALPRTATGKLQRFRVREMARESGVADAPAGDGAGSDRTTTHTQTVV